MLKNNNQTLANEILKKLYNKQKELKAYIYSPFVELELAKLAKDGNKEQESIDYLLESLINPRKIIPNDEVKIY